MPLLRSRDIKPPLKRGTRVRLSPEGLHLLKPRLPLNGIVDRTEAGLIVVRERGGFFGDYHPDFLEPARDDLKGSGCANERNRTQPNASWGRK